MADNNKQTRRIAVSAFEPITDVLNREGVVINETVILVEKKSGFISQITRKGTDSYSFKMMREEEP